MKKNEYSVSKKTVILAIILLCILVSLVTGLIVYNLYGKNKSLVTKESKVIAINVDEILESASDIVALKYYYTDADTYSNSKKVFGKKIPFTTDRVVFKYSGVVSAGIDMSKVKYTIDKEHETITLTLPETKILSHEIDENSFEFYDVKNSVFTETKLEDYTSLMASLKETKEEYLKSDGEFFNSVLDNAKEVIKKFVTTPEEFREYKVIFY